MCALTVSNIFTLSHLRKYKQHISCFVLRCCLWSAASFCVWVLLMLLEHFLGQAWHKQQINRLRLTMWKTLMLPISHRWLKKFIVFLRNSPFCCPPVTPALSSCTKNIYMSTHLSLPLLSSWHNFGIFIPARVLPTSYLSHHIFLSHRKKFPLEENSLRWEYMAFESFDPASL